MSVRKKFVSPVTDRAFVLLKAAGVSNQAAAERANIPAERVRQWQCRPLYMVAQFERFLNANGLGLRVERLQDGEQ